MTKHSILTADEIQKLYIFTRAHFVEWYDLQTELVDHLANDIEQAMAADKSLTFDMAKNKAFAKFGVFGFEDVIKEKRNALMKKYHNILFGAFKKSFFSPVAITLPLLGYCLYVSYMKFEKSIVSSSVFFFLIFICSSYQYFSFKRRFRKEAEASNKKWLFQDVIVNRILVSVAMSGNLFINLLNLLKDEIQTYILIAGSCFAQVILIWFIYLLPYKIIREFETSEKNLNIL